MIRWIPYTFTRILSFLVVGILLGIFFPGWFSVPVTFGILAILLISYIALFSFKVLQSKINAAWIGFPMILLFGISLALIRDERRAADHLVHQKDIRAYTVVIDGYPEEKEKSWKITGRVEYILERSNWKEAQGRVMLYFSRERFDDPFRYGQTLLINGTPELVPGPGNPEEFDYQTYLRYKNIFHQDFVKKDVVLLVSEKGNVIIAASMKTRQWAQDNIRKYIEGTNEQAIASALVLGITDNIDRDVLDAYSNTGTMHVLAVSGLHISIIYVIILFLLKPINRWKSGKVLVAFVSLGLLWSYAFVTGMSPSVLRAVTMFSFVIVAKLIARDSNIFNTLAASAFCLLIVDPFLIMSVGFQLSYLAVLGIIWIHPLIFRLYEPERYLSSQVWTLVSVSVAAQLSTLSLTLLYFHQFPNYFILSNLIVIPVSFVVLVGGLAVLAFSFFEPLAEFLGWVVASAIKIMNGGVVLVDRLPFSTIDDIFINGWQALLVFFMVAGIVLFFQFRRINYLLATAVLVMAFSVFRWVDYTQAIGTDKMIVYKVPGHSAADLFSGGHLFMYADSALCASPSRIRYHLQPARLANYVSEGRFLYEGHTVTSGRNLATHFGGKRILFLKEYNNEIDLGSFDIVVVGADALPDANTADIRPNAVLVLDSSNSYRYCSRLMEQPANAFTIYSVLHNGAFEFVPEDRHEIRSS